MVDETASAEPVTLDDLVGAFEECFDKGWTDGLPVVPPVPGLIERFLAQTSRDPDEVIWYMDQVRRGCTVEFAAVNAVMAGCRAEYFPVVLAALEAVVDEGWPAAGGWQSTSGGGPLLIVNGPVRHELGFNCAGNVFGPGFRANATVGRAIRLIIMNAYGIRPQQLDQSTQGTPGKYTLCIGENEEDSPWEPLHVELGYPAQADVVCALHTRSLEYVDSRNTDDPEYVLNDIADTISRTGSMGSLSARRFKRVGVVFGPEHAQLLARNGFTKQAVKEYLAEHTGRPAWMLRQAGRGAATMVDDVKTAGSVLHGARADDGSVGDDEPIRMLRAPEDILVVVAGAANAGVTTVVNTLGIPPRIPGRAEIRP
jgi:hypothetical protein